jgi:DUF1680 family protein
VRADAGRVALQRGPLVYCLEAEDQALSPHHLLLPPQASLEARFDAELLGGVMKITGDGLAAVDTGWNDPLYRTQPAQTQPSALTAIPYCVWGNRQAGAMLVWVREG